MGDWSFGHWIALGIIIYFAAKIWEGFRAGPETGLVCKSCGFVGEAKSAVRGSLGIEIVLWLCFIIPGLIYSIWRGSSRYDACPQCGGKEMIPADSPIGKKIIADLAAK